MKSNTNKEYRCRICGNDEHKLSYIKNNYQYVTCSYCQVTRQYPYPTLDEINAFYNEYLQIKNKENPLYMSDGSWYEFKRIKDLNFIEMGLELANLKNKKVLDIGCATGLFVRYIEENEGQAFGIDVSIGLIDIAKKKGLNCNCISLFDVKDKYDLINFSHVLEHVDNPINYLRHIHTILNENGELVIETPCTGIISETFAEQWRFYMPLEHIHLFSQESLFRILRNTGFSIIGWVRYGSGNTSGTIPTVNKKVADTIAKQLGIGDTISILCKKISK